MQQTLAALLLLILMTTISPWQSTDAATGSMSKQQAYQLLKAGSSTRVQSLPDGDREILLATLALDAGRTNEAIRILSRLDMKQHPLAAVIRAEAYRQQSVAAARRAGHYAHAVSGDISRLQNARFNTGLAQAEKRLQAFMSGHAIRQAVRARHASTASASRGRLPDSVRRAISAWRRDWESRNGDAYLSHYHPDFRSNKYDFTSWSAYKRRINSRKKYIRVSLSDINVLRGPEQIAQGEAILVSFKQQYQSSNYTANSRKQLYLVRRSGGDKWLIMYEGEASRPYHRSRSKATSPDASHSNRAFTAAGAWVINLGSFDAAANAEHMASGIQLSGARHPFVSSLSVGGKHIHRVRIGFYSSRHDALTAMHQLCPQLGLSDCWPEQVKP